MLYNQPLATRFGSDLISHINAGKWTKLDIAVAWVRASGIAYLKEPLSNFLQSGNCITVIVGIDFTNTTQEGLQSLLDLSTHGDIKTVIHHNESGVIFHPKMYLFSNASDAKLIVGSNNITQAGLYQNTEAGLEVDLPINDPTIQTALNVLKSWADMSTGLAKPLNSTLLSELIKEGYVQDEAAAKKAAATSFSSAKRKKRKKKLFNTIYVTPPLLPSTKSPVKVKPKSKKKSTKKAATSLPSPAVGEVLLMRVRKAHKRDRPTQTQVPKAVANAPFFGGVSVVTSSHNGDAHGIHAALARGIVNTLKLEIPEMRTFDDPVIRFERTAAGISYEAYDVDSPSGSIIMDALKKGMSSTPKSTHLTLPGKPSNSTWWRFI